MRIGKNILITGGAGFIGSHLVDKLINNHRVIVYDNLSTGEKKFLSQHFNNPNFEFIEDDLLNFTTLNTVMNEKEIDFVFHFAANADIALGTEKTDTDLKQGTIATYNVLESMRLNDVKDILFPSSCTVYGEPTKTYLQEDYGPLTPISLYGASKLACEGLISAFVHLFEFNAWIYRFANVIGSRETHGVIVDFIRKLRNNHTELEILGDGNQKKSYLHVDDCIDAMLIGVDKTNCGLNIFNLGTDDWISVTRIAEIVVEEMNLRNVKFRYTGGNRGWRGDIPRILLSIDKLKSIGWKPKYSSEEAVKKTVRDLLNEKVDKNDY